MTVAQILEMPASELSGWFAHFRLSLIEQKREAEKQKNKGR